MFASWIALTAIAYFVSDPFRNDEAAYVVADICLATLPFGLVLFLLLFALTRRGLLTSSTHRRLFSATFPIVALPTLFYSVLKLTGIS